MTAPVVDAGFLAPIVARLDALESAVAIIREIVDRHIGDVGHLDVAVDGLAEDMRELRAALRGRS